MKDMIETFLVVFAVGGLISSAAWYYSRRLAQRSLMWRGSLCILLAGVVTPTCFQLSGHLAVYPAVATLALICEGKNPSFCLQYGALPMFVAAGMMLAIWSVLVQRRRDHVA
jgi:hypothetical protein